MESPNKGLRNDSFRNYADYMLTQEFMSAAAEVMGHAREKRTAYMCAERMWFQCHRMLVSDYFTAQGWRVMHITDRDKPPREHKLTGVAQVEDGRLTYPGLFAAE